MVLSATVTQRRSAMVVSMILESVLIAIFGAVLGVVLGVVTGWALVRTLARWGLGAPQLPPLTGGQPPVGGTMATAPVQAAPVAGSAPGAAASTPLLQRRTCRVSSSDSRASTMRSSSPCGLMIRRP